MKDTQNITIGMLLVTAGILALMIVGTYFSATPAYGAAASVKQNDFIMVAAADGSKDLLYVIKISARRINAYEVKGDSLNIIASEDLERIFAR